MPSVNGTAGERGRLIVVDDDGDMVAFLERILTHYGFKLKAFTSASAALEEFSRNAAEYDVVLTDINMPGLNGLDLMKALRDVDPQSVVIALTGFPSADNAIASLKNGAFDLIEKPCAGEALALSLDKGVEMRRLRASLKQYQTQLEDMLDVRTHELKAALVKLDLSYMKTLEVIVGLLELKEPDTAQHSLRVGHRTACLAAKMGVPPGHALEAIRRGGILHDIGKIGIPDVILNKPAKLDADEMNFMKRHPKIGYDIVAIIPEMNEAAQIVLSHHERFDGKGYPRGLKGEEICFGARIFTVIDSYDAIRFDRCYRKGSSMEESLAEIERGSGTQFDPVVVEAFKANIAEIEKI